VALIGPELAAGNQADAALESDICPGPLAEHRHAVPESNQPEDVQAQPEHPRQPSGRAHGPDVHDRRTAANRGDVAEVEVTERLERLPGDRPRDVPRRVGALLLGDLRYARQRLAVLLKRADVAGDEGLGA